MCPSWLADSSAEVIDGSTLSFLLQRALEVKRKEEEEAVETAELVGLEEKVVAAEDRLLRELEKGWAQAVRVTTQSWPTLSRVEQLATMWFLAKENVRKRKVKTEEEEEAVLLFMMSLTVLFRLWVAVFAVSRFSSP